MPDPTQLPPWFITIVLSVLTALMMGVVKVLSSRYVKIEKQVETLAKELSERVKYSDLQTMSDGIRLDHIATQKRLDDIFTLIGKL